MSVKPTITMDDARWVVVMYQDQFNRLSFRAFPTHQYAQTKRIDDILEKGFRYDDQDSHVIIPPWGIMKIDVSPEWGSVGATGHYCPACGARQEDGQGHDEGCELVAFVKEQNRKQTRGVAAYSAIFVLLAVLYVLMMANYGYLLNG